MKIIEDQVLINTPRGIKIDFNNNQEPVLIRNCKVIEVSTAEEDGIQFLGLGMGRVENCYASASGLKPDHMDELASVVQGADVIFDHCYFDHNGKGVLVGSGDTIGLDYASLRAAFFNCVFNGNCRRNVYAQFGQTRMQRCWVNNWGISSTFHEKMNGAHAGKHGQLMVSNCVFTQRPFLDCIDENFIEDITHQYQHWPYPGFMKAVYAEFGGQVKAYHCYKNRWWLRIENHIDPMQEVEANELMHYLQETVMDSIEK